MTIVHARSATERLTMRCAGVAENHTASRCATGRLLSVEPSREARGEPRRTHRLCAMRARAAAEVRAARTHDGRARQTAPLGASHGARPRRRSAHSIDSPAASEACSLVMSPNEIYSYLAGPVGPVGPVARPAACQTNRAGDRLDRLLDLNRATAAGHGPVRLLASVTAATAFATIHDCAEFAARGRTVYRPNPPPVRNQGQKT